MATLSFGRVPLQLTPNTFATQKGLSPKTDNGSGYPGISQQTASLIFYVRNNYIPM